MTADVPVRAGPLGQCHPLPEDLDVREQMLKHARNYERIYRSYNLPYQSRPGSDMAKAIDGFKAQLASWQKKLKRIQELEQRRLRRLERRSGVKPDAAAKEVCTACCACRPGRHCCNKLIGLTRVMGYKPSWVATKEER
jgi:hypothetical protein